MNYALASKGKAGIELTELTLEAIGASEEPLLSNLLELYIHDLSAWFPHVQLGANGRFGYPALPGYLSGENGRAAFLMRYQGSVAGFVLARRGSPVSDDPNVLDIGEFFVLRQFRGRGAGRAAAKLLWDRLPGSWTVRASTRNVQAVAFWRGVVSEYTNGRALERERVEGSSNWVVLSFDNSR